MRCSAERLLLVLGSLLAATSCNGWGNKPEFPERILAGSESCEHCSIDPRRPTIGGVDFATTCAYNMRYECPSGGSCAKPIPCEPMCCPPPEAQLVGLDEPPWGPALRISDPRPPSGVLVQHADSDFSLMRPSETQVQPTPILRLRAQIQDWRWAAGPRQIIFAADERLHRFDLATQTIAELPDIAVSYGGFDVDAAGERVATVGLSRPSTVTTISLGADTNTRAWTMPQGLALFPAWQPNGSNLLFTLELGHFQRFRVADPVTRAITDSPKDHLELVQPFWHPSGTFLGIWRSDADGCRLLLIEPDGRRHAETPLRGEPGDCPLAQFSPDGRHLVLVREKTLVELVTLPNWSERRVVSEHGTRSLRWLDDAAAEALAGVAGFGAQCKSCAHDPVTPTLAGTDVGAAIAEHTGHELPGGLISFAAILDGRPQVHAITPRGDGMRVLTDMDPGAIGPDFSPDGRGLVFITSDRERLAILDLAHGQVYSPDTLETLKLGIPGWTDGGTALTAAAINTAGNPSIIDVWSWKFAHDHWGTLIPDNTDRPGSMDARPSSAPIGERLPRMIAATWHPSRRFFAAWVGAGGRYRLAWVSADGRAWFDAGVRYDAIGAAANVAEPATVAFAPSGSHFVFARPDPELGGLTLELASIADTSTTTTLARLDGRYPDLSWSVDAAAEHVATAELPYSAR